MLQQEVCCKKDQTTTTTEEPIAKPFGISTKKIKTSRIGFSEDEDYSGHKNLKLVNERYCGNSLSVDRIVGGEIAKVHEFPWLAMMQYINNEGVIGFKCGGSLIASRYILTGELISV